MREPMNQSRIDVLKSLLGAAAGLFFFGFGVYLTIQANIGADPWDVFHIGLAHTFGVLYGTASIAVSLVILVIDILLRESIGFGMVLDAFLVGKTVDLFQYINLIPLQKGNLPVSLLLLTAGVVVEAYAQFLYMRAGLGCGPRDALLVGLRRRVRIPIGLVSVGILALVTAAGYLLGGPVGIGTVICAFCIGPVMQGAFATVRFDPSGIRHQSLAESLRVLSSGF